MFARTSFFCFRLRALSLSLFFLLFASCRRFSDVPPSPVVLVIWCKYPKCVSFYILYFCHHGEVVLGLCEACNNGGNHNTDHNARLEREMLNLKQFHPALPVSVLPMRGFCFKLYNVEKNNNNNNKLLSHLINCILKEMVVCKRLDCSQSTTF